MPDHNESLLRIEREANDLKGVFPWLVRARYVPGHGNDTDPYAMVVGSVPTALDEMHLRPFQDEQSRMVFELLKLSGLNAHNTWITHGIKFRLPGNRAPIGAELRKFRPLLQQEWMAVGEPPIIITIGNTATSLVLGYTAGSSIQPGRCIEKNRIRIWPMLHPSVGVRHADVRDEIENHWLSLGKWIRKHGSA